MHLELRLGLSLSSLQRRTFAEFHSSPTLDLLFWDALIFFFSCTISWTFSLPTQLLSWCFSLEPFAQFHPVARCLSPSFGFEKCWSSILQLYKNYKMSNHKLLPALALKSYLRDPEVLIGQAKLFDIYAANQNQGAKCICSPRISRLARNKARFTESTLSFGRAYWYNINLTVPKIKERMAYCLPE